MAQHVWTTQLYIAEASRVHNNKYDYSLTKYIDARTKIIIICPTHGEFAQIPRKHLSGSKCAACAWHDANTDRRLTSAQFLDRAKQAHEDHYDYSKVKLGNNVRDLITIICPKHGEFTQTVLNHINGHGCKLCATTGKKSQVQIPIFDNQWFIKRAMNVHGDRYDYSKTIYTKSTNKLAIICKSHGEFLQTARDHLNGYGCAKCGLNSLSVANALTKDEFVAEAIKLHNSKYDYSEVQYVNQATKINIICQTHGSFEQTPKHHLRGQGCPVCQVSSGQLSMANFVQSLLPPDSVISNNRTALRTHEIDIYIPSHNLGIEYNGIHWHSYNQPETREQRLRHVHKLALAKANGIELMQFWETEWLRKRSIVESMIRCRLGFAERFNARSLSLVRLRDCDAEPFFNACHIMGHRQAALYYALVDDGGIKCCMSFSRHPEYGYELIRYACALGMVVRGGPSRLFARFVTEFGPLSVLTFADRRFFSGKMYIAMGFEFVADTRPNYCYCQGLELWSRQQFQKGKLAEKLDDFNPVASETVNMFANGYRRLWDAGHGKFVWKKSKH